MVNANLSDEERLNDTNHQYVKKNKDYCVKCGHYPEVSYIVVLPKLMERLAFGIIC